MSSGRLPEDLADQVRRALAEDIGEGDITAALLDASATSSGRAIAREGTVLCGRPWVDEVYRQLDPNLTRDGPTRKAPTFPPARRCTQSRATAAPCSPPSAAR